MAQTEGSMVGYAMRGGLYLGLSMIVCLVIYALVIGVEKERSL